MNLDGVDQQWVVTKVTLSNFYIRLFLVCIFFIGLVLYGVYIYKNAKNYFKIYVFFFTWFVLGIAMLLQVFPLDMTVADRWFYFPFVGLLGMLGTGVHLLLLQTEEKYKQAKPATIWLVTILLLLLSLRTIVRNTNFYDETTLFTHDTAIQNNPALDDYVAGDYFQAGDKQKAFLYEKKSIDLQPNPYNYYHLGTFYEKKGKFQNAAEVFYQGLKLAHRSGVTSDKDTITSALLIKVTKNLLLSADYSDCAKLSMQGARSYSNNISLWIMASLCENKLHRYDQALISATKAKSLAPDDFTNLLYMAAAARLDIPSATITQMLLSK